MINNNNDPQSAENKEREYELLIPKFYFEALEVDVEQDYQHFIKNVHTYDYEFHFVDNNEAETLARNLATLADDIEKRFAVEKIQEIIYHYYNLKNI